MTVYSDQVIITVNEPCPRPEAINVYSYNSNVNDNRVLLDSPLSLLHENKKRNYSFLYAEALLSDGSVVDITADATWTPTQPDLLSISKSSPNHVFVKSREVGSTDVTVSYAGSNTIITINILPDTGERFPVNMVFQYPYSDDLITINSDTGFSLHQGDIIYFSSQVNMSDGTIEKPGKNQYTLISSGENIQIIPPTNREPRYGIQAIAGGITSVTATYNDTDFVFPVNVAGYSHAEYADTETFIQPGKNCAIPQIKIF